MDAHNGQSNVWLAEAPSSSPCTTSFMLPVVVQTKSMALGLTTGDAMATPTDNTHHTSTKRASRRALRKVCMTEILSTQPRPIAPCKH